MTALTAFVGLAGVLSTGLAADTEETGSALIRRVVAQTSRSGITVHATRHLEAGTIAGGHRGWMDVDTSVSPSGGFSWKVLGEGGSERTREKVLRAGSRPKPTRGVRARKTAPQYRWRITTSSSGQRRVTATCVCG